MYKYFSMVALLVLMPCAFAAPSAACSAPEYHRLNFWLGDWDTYEANGRGPSEARNHVTSILGGCVILENYRGADGLHGESFTIYDASRHIWHQSWVTNRGHWLVLEGRFKAYTLTLQGRETLADGKQALIRGIWKPQLDGVRETAYVSESDGKTWTVDFDILFKRHRGK